MLGRGIDQILRNPGELQLFEPYATSAATYIELAERATGRIPKPASFDYAWGDALAELERVRPDARIVNLETAVTVSSDPWPEKRIHYCMHPGGHRLADYRGGYPSVRAQAQSSYPDSGERDCRLNLETLRIHARAPTRTEAGEPRGPRARTRFDPCPSLRVANLGHGHESRPKSLPVDVGLDATRFYGMPRFFGAISLRGWHIGGERKLTP